MEFKMFGRYEKVLIVDDCEVLRRRLDKELRTQGFSIQTADDGVEALKLIETQEFDFVITDWDMPNLDGELLCRCLRSDQNPDRYIVSGHQNGYCVAVYVGDLRESSR